MHRPRSRGGHAAAVEFRRRRRRGDQSTRTPRTSTPATRYLLDSSGLSVDDRLTAKTLDGVVQAAAGPDEPKLRPLLDLLPIAGGSGTLSDRFLDATPRRRAGRLAAGQDRLADRDQRVSWGGDRPQRTGADLRADLQRRRAEWAHGDRRRGLDPVVVRMRDMTPSAELTVGRTVDWGFAATVGQRLARPGPAVHRLHPPPGGRQPGDRRQSGRAAGARRHRSEHRRRGAGGPHHRPAGLDSGRRRIDAGDDRRDRQAARPDQRAAHRRADRCGAGVRLVRDPRPVRPVQRRRRRPAAGLPQRHRGRAPIAGRARRFPAVGVPARGHPPRAVHRQPVAVRLHVASAGRADHRHHRRRRAGGRPARRIRPRPR